MQNISGNMQIITQTGKKQAEMLKKVIFEKNTGRDIL